MRILLADDHQLVRQTLAAYLGVSGHSVDEAKTFDEALSAANADGNYDLVVLDYLMPGMEGLKGLETMCNMMGDRPVVLISGTASASIAREALATGARGFLPKTMSVATLAKALKWIELGEVYVPMMLVDPDSRQAVLGDGKTLSDRELQVLTALTDGKTNKEIASELGLQEATVKMHVNALLKKLGAKNRTHAAMIALGCQLI